MEREEHYVSEGQEVLPVRDWMAGGHVISTKEARRPLVEAQHGMENCGHHSGVPGSQIWAGESEPALGNLHSARRPGISTTMTEI